MKKSDGRGAAKGLTLDNVEDSIVALREVSAPTRNSKKLRDAARLKKQREERAKQKQQAASRPAGK
jgi:hypothetical protein